MSKIIKLDVKNVKRIKAVHIEPDGSVVILGGQNKQGKSSVLDAIMMALAGGKTIPPVPLHRGEKRGHVRIDLDDVIVTRTFTEGGGGSLTVDAKIGDTTARVQSPQAWLDARIGALSFDPLAFLRQDPKKQAETLRRLVGIDTSGLDAERAEVFAQRTAINRQARDAEGAARDLPVYADAPSEPVNIASLTADLQRAQAENRTADEAGRTYEAALSQVQACERTIRDLRMRLKQEEAALAEAQAAEESAKKTLDGCTRTATDPLISRLEQADESNQQVRANQSRAKAIKDADALKEQSDLLTMRLDEIDDEKARTLAYAHFPVPGLSLGDDGGVTYDGLPVEQASSAEKAGISMAVAMAMNPNVRLAFIRDGSLLDAQSLAMICDLAAQHDAQVWIERVGDGDVGAVVIEDGMVRPVGEDKGDLL